MSALPYMQLYVADYLADTAHLTAIEHGAYLLLIMNYWQRGKPLPSDDYKLCRIARMTPEEWASCRGTIAEFFEVDGDVWRHTRVDEDLSKVADKSEKAKAAGRASAERRSSNAERALYDRSTNVERTVSHKDTEADTEQKLSLRSSRASASSFDAFWSAYPHKVGKDAARKAFDKAMKRDSGLTIPRLVEAIDAYRRFKPPDREWCNPATWLNQGRWNDVWTEGLSHGQPQHRQNGRPAAGRNGTDSLVAAFLAEAARPDDRGLVHGRNPGPDLEGGPVLDLEPEGPARRHAAGWG